MNIRFSITTLPIACLIAACASPHFSDYEGTAQRVAFANLCEKEGYVSKEQFAAYADFQFGDYARQWTVDDAKLMAMYLQQVEVYKDWQPKTYLTREEVKISCAKIAMVAQRVSNPAPAQPMYPVVRPTTTNCVRIGTMTNCTTY